MRLSHVPKLTLSFFFIFLPFFHIYAQDYLANIQYFGIEDGLSHRDVYDIHQDKEGFIWGGTKYGLNRFDGYEFKWYAKEKDGLGSKDTKRFTINSSPKYCNYGLCPLKYSHYEF